MTGAFNVLFDVPLFFHRKIQEGIKWRLSRKILKECSTSVEPTMGQGSF